MRLLRQPVSIKEQLDPAALLEAILEATPDGILVVDQVGQIVMFNQKFAQLWGIPESTLETRDDETALAVAMRQLRDPDQFMRKVRELYRQPEARSEDTLELRDGRLVERDSQPLRLRGWIVGRVWSFRELTEESMSRKAVEESEKRLRTLIETAEAGIVALDRENNIRLVNPKMASILGYGAAELSGGPIHSFASEIDRHRISILLERRRKGLREDYELKLLRKDGTPVWCHISASPILDALGQYDGSVGVVTDVSERKRLELELQRSRDRLDEVVRERSALLEAMLEYVSDAVCIKDSELRYLYFNRAAQRLLGYSEHELKGKTDHELFPREQAEVAAQAERRALESGHPQEIGEEKVHSRKHGTLTVRTCKVPIHASPDKAKFVLGVSQDVTARVLVEQERAARSRAERAARRAEFLADLGKQLASSLEPSACLATLAGFVVPELADGCWLALTDEQGQIEATASAHRDPERANILRQIESRLAGGPAPASPPWEAGARGPVVHRDVPPESLLAEDVDILFALGARSYVTLPFIARDRALGILVAASQSDPRRYGPEEAALVEEVARLAASALDNARLYQRSLGQVRAREEFISVASHELKTPLTPLAAQLQLIQRVCRQQDPQAGSRTNLERLLTLAEHDVARLTRLVDNLLDVSRVRAGKLILSPEHANLSELVASVIKRLETESSLMRCRLEPDLQDPLMATFDRLRIDQVVSNLINNAIKFGRGKPIHVSLGQQDGRAVLKVKDHGIGISPEDQKKVFQRFERAVSERQFRGLGLGLYIARQIVQAHRGSIRVESTPGQGSTFTVELPLEP